jgi:hypothetical protein
MEMEEGYLSDSKVSTILMVQVSIFLSDFRRRVRYGYGGVGKGGWGSWDNLALTTEPTRENGVIIALYGGHARRRPTSNFF